MKVKIKKLHPDAVIPEYKTAGASGFDLVALEDTLVMPGETKMVKTGIAVEVPEGYELQVRPRSGTSLKTPLRVANSPGTVDSDYRGECCVIMTNMGVAMSLDNTPGKTRLSMSASQMIKKGDRIAQGVICPVVHVEFEEVQELSDSIRGSSGFGSSGK
jgi:dUTP pyrophosphatase